MFLTLFTKRRQEISGRLRLLARAFMAFGALLGAFSIGFFLVTWSEPELLDRIGTGAVARTALFGLLRAASLIIIGRALLRRQRWGGYLAIIALISPFIQAWWTLGPPAPGSASTFIVVALAAFVASVWRELGSARDFDLLDDIESVHNVPVRNRGFHEPAIADPTRHATNYDERPRLIEPNPMTTSTAASTPLPTNNPRAN